MCPTSAESSLKQLAVMPKGFALAPEDNEFSEQIRQMVFGRYRLLFTLKERKVHVLHVRGAYAEAMNQPEGDWEIGAGTTEPEAPS